MNIFPSTYLLDRKTVEFRTHSYFIKSFPTRFQGSSSLPFFNDRLKHLTLPCLNFFKFLLSM